MPSSACDKNEILNYRLKLILPILWTLFTHFRNADILGFNRSHKDNKAEVEEFIKSKF